MVPRYSRPELVQIWTDQNKYKLWYEIELEICRAQAAEGYIPQEVVTNLEKIKGIVFDVDRINSIEQDVHHDVIAFLTYISELIGENSRYVHLGVTSSDILDTCFGLQLRQSIDEIIVSQEILRNALKEKALEHKYTLCIGRSHGIHAEPTTFGLKMLQAYSEISRSLKRLMEAREEINYCAISGPVGNYSAIPPIIEKRVAKALNMNVEPVSTQVIPRDRHAAYFSALAITASSLERIAVEVRHLQRTEVAEAEEFFSSKQKGSSAMPHKRNPILSENVTGLCRLIRGYFLPSLENVALWHERDISHSSVERNIGPDATIALDFALRRMGKVIDGLQVNQENMQRNMNSTRGVYFSQQVLVTLVDKGVSREQSYRYVQAAAMRSWSSGTEFKDELRAQEGVAELINDRELDSLFNHEKYMKYVNDIFDSVFVKYP